MIRILKEKGVVIKSTGSWYVVKTTKDEFVDCRIKGRFRIKGIRSTNPVAVGDKVRFIRTVDNTGVISDIEERENYIIRKATKLSKASHIIAANIDQAYLIVTMVKPRTSRGFIDRFLVTTEAYHVPCSIIFNKIDIYDKETLELHNNLVNLYTSLGYPCYSVSAITGENIDDLKDNLKGKTTLMSGHSGVGKSALINSLDGELDLRTGDLSDVHEKGKHTTTFAEMFELGFGAKIVDTPGVKEFGLFDFDRKEVAERFPEFRNEMKHCKFSNCSHVHEPGCAVVEAVKEGRIDIVRYQNYISIINDDYFELKEWD
ncbi:MAG: ribosome small subunit-dependent GTPase A [Bacteroidota bacterium]|nr:ribosome small subunit-dependent GTPase A [Bacteroidota bacterium]